MVISLGADEHADTRNREGHTTLNSQEFTQNKIQHLAKDNGKENALKS